MTPDSCPRLVVAGTAGDSGKTLISMGLLSAWRAADLQPAPFKKGPDYIDAAWLAWAAGRPCRNLDTFMQPEQAVRAAVVRHGSAGINVIEGNRGLHDGFDADGTHSTAALARLLEAPVVLAVSGRKVTRTVAAVVLGCRELDPGLDLAGVVLNRVRGQRHRELIRAAVESATGVPVLGVVPPLKDEELLPGRHLGLVPPQEREGIEGLAPRLARLARQCLDLDRLLELGRRAPPLTTDAPAAAADTGAARPRIGVFSDSAFTFYYPENLEALQAAGAELVRVSGLADPALPRVHALYLGGGFPETHAFRLAANRPLLREVRGAARAGMPIYAECGGLVYLCRELTCGGETHAMAGVLPAAARQHGRPRGHGYVELRVDAPNPYFVVGQTLRGHEFHYTSLDGEAADLSTAFQVLRGTGSGAGRDGIVLDNVVASYTHLHATGAPQWAPALVQSAARFRDRAAGDAHRNDPAYPK